MFLVTHKRARNYTCLIGNGGYGYWHNHIGITLIDVFSITACLAVTNMFVSATNGVFVLEIARMDITIRYEKNNCYYFEQKLLYLLLYELAQCLLQPLTTSYGANPGSTGPRWAPCWPHGLCYLGYFLTYGTFSLCDVDTMLPGIVHIIEFVT